MIVFNYRSQMVMRYYLLAIAVSVPLISAAQDSLIMKSIYFGGGSYYVDPLQAQELYDFIDQLLPELEKYEITITSHTDNIGGKEFNHWLSKMRSGAVLEHLNKKTIPPDKVRVKDWGMENPIYDNRSLSGRLRNRRVDVVFTPVVF